MAMMWDVYTLKEGTKYDFLKICAEYFVLTDCAMPIDFYMNKNKEGIGMQLVVKEFFPNSPIFFGISVYSFTKEQFEETFVSTGKNINEFLKDKD